jgi:hypothetical protein
MYKGKTLTNKECIRQIRTLMGSRQKGGLKWLLRESDRLINSGGVDLLEEEKDSFFLPKIILSVALENLSEQFAPISQTGSEIAENLKEF